MVLRNKRAKNPEAIQSLVEELKMASPTYTFRSGKKTKTDPPIAGVLEYLATLEQKERAAAEEENRPLGDTLLLSDLKKSQAYKDVMGIKEPYRTVPLVVNRPTATPGPSAWAVGLRSSNSERESGRPLSGPAKYRPKTIRPGLLAGTVGPLGMTLTRNRFGILYRCPVFSPPKDLYSQHRG